MPPKRSTYTPFSPLTSQTQPTRLRRLPLSEAVSILRTGKASQSLPQLKSLKVIHDARLTQQGFVEFRNRYIPQIAYANPELPFTFDVPSSSRLAKIESGEEEVVEEETDAPTSSTPISTTVEKTIQSKPPKIIFSFNDGTTETATYTTQSSSEILEEVLAISRREAIRRVGGERVLGIDGGTGGTEGTETVAA